MSAEVDAATVERVARAITGDAGHLLATTGVVRAVLAHVVTDPDTRAAVLTAMGADLRAAFDAGMACAEAWEGVWTDTAPPTSDEAFAAFVEALAAGDKP